MSTEHTPQAGDIYELTRDSTVVSHYELVGEPDERGHFFAKKHLRNGTTVNTSMSPSLELFKYREPRPEFPTEGQIKFPGLGMTSNGGLAAASHTDFNISPEDVRGLPWRYADGTLVPDEDKMEKEMETALQRPDVKKWRTPKWFDFPYFWWALWGEGQARDHYSPTTHADAAFWKGRGRTPDSGYYRPATDEWYATAEELPDD